MKSVNFTFVMRAWKSSFRLGRGSMMSCGCIRAVLASCIRAHALRVSGLGGQGQVGGFRGDEDILVHS